MNNNGLSLNFKLLYILILDSYCTLDLWCLLRGAHDAQAYFLLYYTLTTLIVIIIIIIRIILIFIKLVIIKLIKLITSLSTWTY